MALYLGNSLIDNIYIGTTAAGINNTTLATPTIAVNASGLITAKVTQTTAGFIAANSTTQTTQQLSTVNSSTITPSSTTQTAVAANKYTLGTITVAAVPTETKEITSNGTYTPTAGTWFSSVTVNVPTGSTINNQNKTVTPTTARQTINADSGYTGLGTVTVNAIPSGYIVPSGNKAITTNGSGIDVTAYATVSVNVPTGSTINNQNKTVTPTTSQQSISADTGYTGLGTVTVNAIPSTYIIPTGNKSITANGTNIDVAQYSTVSVNVSINTQTKTVTPFESSQTITPDTGYGGLSQVTVNAVSSTYVGSGITKKSAATITPGTSNQTIAAGTYLTGVQTIQGDSNLKAANIKSGVSIFGVAGSYAGAGVSLQSKTVTPSTSQQIVQPDSGYDGLSSVTVNAVTAMTLPTSASSSATAGYTAKATIDRSTADQYINIPQGYNSSGAYYKISAVANGSVTAPSSISGTSATVSTATNSITLTKTVSITPNVTTAGYISSGTAGNSSISLTASITTKGAATITPGTSNQTIAAGTYLTGIQTITGDANLIGSNILSGISIFGVAGTVVVQKYYTGSSAPSSSLGNNGDIYLQE